MKSNYHELLFDLIILLMYMLYGLFILGVSKDAEKYISSIDYYIKIFISLFLIYRFNSFRKINTFTAFDKRMAFSAGILILFATLIDKLLTQYSRQIQDFKSDIYFNFFREMRILHS